MSLKDKPESKGAPIDKVLAVMRILDGDTAVTPEIFNEIIAIAASIENLKVKIAELEKTK